jgi:cell division septum initiation protein DivIVA
MDQMTPAPKNRSNTVLLFLVVLLLVSNVVLLYMWSQKGDQAVVAQQQVVAVTSEKENVTKLLEDMLSQYDTLSTDNERLKTEMSSQQKQIEELMDKVKNGNYSVSKAKKEAETLRRIMQGYVVTIDSLNQVNQALTAENLSTKQELGEVKGQKQALETQGAEKDALIARGSVLRSTVMTAGGMFERNSGKQVDTERANKTEQVKCCFTLGENLTAKPGPKTLYVRVISPDGSVLPTEGGNARFQFNGVEGEYSAKREADYQNKPLDMCIFWKAPGKMASGQYIVEVYESGGQVGTTSFNLK